MKYNRFDTINRNRYWCNKGISHVARPNSVD